METNPTNISNLQLKAIIDNEPETVVLDVRTLEEYTQLGHVPKAILLPIDQVPVRISELDKARKTVVICQHGVRSMHSALYLIQEGFTEVFNHQQGMCAWDGPISHEFPENMC